MSEKLKYSLAFGALGALFFIPFLGGVHLFDWDEINFAEISREMIVMDNYLRVHVDFKPFWEKPPFYFWLQVLAMKTFGINEFAARLPNAVCGVLTLIILYNIGRKLRGHWFGAIWAGAYFGSILPFLYFKSGIIDPWFNLFIFLGIWFFVQFYWKKDGFEGIALSRNKWFYLLLGGFFIGMGILTKGQVAYLIVGLAMAVYWVVKKFRLYISPLHFVVFTAAAASAMLAWYGVETLKNGSWFIHEFNRYQFRLFSTPDAGHAGFPGYHFVVLFLGVFPASIFAIRSFFRLPEGDSQTQLDFRLWMKILFWVVLILFTIVKSKIVHYSSMCYFPMTFLAAEVIEKIWNRQLSLNGWMRTGLVIVGGIFAAATIALPFLGQNVELLKPLFAKDPFGLANLEAEVRWTGWEILPGLVMIAALVAFFFFVKKGNFQHAFAVLFGGTALFVLTGLIFDVKKIEGYSQRAAIEFFKSKQSQDCYVMTHGYKSYGHLFYTQKPIPANPNAANKDWLYGGDVDKPVYVVTKINKAHQLAENPNFKEVGRKNGFVFFRREKVSNE